MPSRIKSAAPIVLPAALFFALGLAFLPRLGFEYDEVVFVQLFLHPERSFFAAHCFHRAIPLMQMSYAGALKVWLYALILPFWEIGVYSIRIPVLLLATVTVLLIGATLQRLASLRAAVLVCAILATDLSFLLPSVFDWGPVVIQNFLLAAALYFLLVHGKKEIGIAAAACACGLALWDKAIFLWIFSGLCVSAIVFCFGVIRGTMTVRRFAIVSVALLIGAAPAVIYNFSHHGGALATNINLSFAEIRPKLDVLLNTVNNQGFGNFFVGRSNNPWSSHRVPIFVCLLLAGIALARREQRRLLLWLLTGVALAWLQAAGTKNAGGFAHHIVIFYPAIVLALGISAEEIAMRFKTAGTPFVAIAGVATCALGCIVIYGQHNDFLRLSPSVFWTDADEALAQFLTSHKDRPALIADWGIAAQADVRTGGALNLEEISFILKDGAVTSQQMKAWEEAKALIVVHTPEHTMFPGQNAKLVALAVSYGLALAPAAAIPDRAGHPLFQVFVLSRVR